MVGTGFTVNVLGLLGVVDEMVGQENGFQGGKEV